MPVQATALRQVVHRNSRAVGHATVAAGRAVGVSDVLAAVVDRVGVGRGGQAAELAGRVGTTAHGLVVDAGEHRAVAGGRRPGRPVVVGVAGQRGLAGQLGLERATGLAVGVQDRVQRGGAALRATLGRRGADIRPGRGGWRGRIVERCLEGRQVRLVQRGTGLDVESDGGLAGVVGVLERLRRGVVGERRRRRGGRGGRRRDVGQGRRAGDGITERGVGHHAHGVLTAGRGHQHDLRLRRGRRTGDGVTRGVQQVVSKSAAAIVQSTETFIW